MLGTRWLLLIGVVGCKQGELRARPTALDWGSIDFQQDMPDGGYAEQELGLLNKGEGDLLVSMVDFDFDHLCVVGWQTGQLPVELPVIEPGQNYTLYISVCDYLPEAGERDTEVTGTLEFETDGLNGALSVPWSFTPTLGFE